MFRNNFVRAGLSIATLGLVLLSALPTVSAQTQAVITPRGTVSFSSGVSTASAAATKIAGTASALATKGAQLKLTLTPFTATGSSAATTAITDYATSVLGTSVVVKTAGGLSGNVVKTVTQTPRGTPLPSTTAKLAVISYAATLSNGTASLSYGSGTVTGNVQWDVQGSSFGVYTLGGTYTGTLTSSAALALAKKTFPALANFAYTTETAAKGYAWYVRTNVSGYDVKTRKFTTMVEAVLLYVLPTTTGKATITATVGRGDFATNVKP